MTLIPNMPTAARPWTERAALRRVANPTQPGDKRTRLFERVAQWSLPVEAPLPIDFKELVRSRTDIVQLIRETVTLVSEQEGLVYKGRCPFHVGDLSEAFNVSPGRQS